MTEEEMRRALRPVVREARCASQSWLARREAWQRSWRALSCSWLSPTTVAVEGEVVAGAHAQRITLTDKTSPHRAVVVWSTYNLGMNLTEARRVRGRAMAQVIRRAPLTAPGPGWIPYKLCSLPAKGNPPCFNEHGSQCSQRAASRPAQIRRRHDARAGACVAPTSSGEH